ncbi:uncharacterized protein FA14DRAFT_159161 [Meira miltonrushii]|uniref:DFDF domain-containing protein n=1 Tax=Meira miltonrushii TaxID=1280837 RepID=A0A316VKE8_9BASI|nr:uncharacterized protein FA14DRAFT_159161 [Meira miltonrushii]PWN36803.1 hypothetical protein FA14DRAFT_159161 [Meira miltonrushii]
MSSFLGSRVSIQLQRGGQLQGKIVHIDGNTGSLSIEQDGTGARLTITRGDIADLRILNNPPPQPQPPTHSDPAVISYANATAGASSSSSTPKHHGKPIPTAPAAMQASLSGGGASKKSSAKKNGTKTPDTHAGKSTGKAGKGKRSTTNTESDLEEDFDFDKAMKGFDKKKIWEEIRTSDKSDPSLLLVSHNRKMAEGGNGQEKLAWDEPVLDPSSPPSSSSIGKQNGSNKQANHSLSMSNVQSELDQVRGNTLQKDLELSKLRDQVRDYQTRIFLLESLSGLEMSAQKEEKWNVTLYESANAHSEAKRHAHKNAPSPHKGVLTVSIAHAGDRLRYLGPVKHLSDETVIERLPSQYRGNEIGLKPETASLFFRRVRDAIQAPSSTA